MIVDMGVSCSSYFKILFFLISLSVSFSVSSLLSDDILRSHSLVGRSLLQTKKACSVHFNAQNYTIITSQCKGPKYPPGPCCKAFKEFACPFAAVINDLSTDCAEQMFNYIHQSGTYPQGLFSSICAEGNDGISCPSPPPQPAADDTSGVSITHNLYLLSMLTTSCLVLPFVYLM